MIDWTKPIRRKDGLKVELVRKLNRPIWPYLVVVHYPSGMELPVAYKEDGTDEPGTDLENVPEERFVWVNVYPDRFGYRCNATKEDADQDASKDRIGRMKIKLEERWDE